MQSCRNILLSILKNYGTTLNNESLQTLVTEKEAIVNSNLMTFETLSDPTSPKSLSSANLLTLKTRVLMPPPGNFDQPDIYSRRRWRRIQDLANKFRSRWKNEFLSTLQSQQKSNDFQKIEVGDVVLLKTNNMNWNK